MVRAQDMLGGLRIALVWLLALIVAPLGGGSFERERNPGACESWCPCETEHEEVAHEEADEDEGCDDDCREDCSGCCDARVAVAVVGVVRLPAIRLGSFELRGSPPAAPGSGVSTGVFRPPRSLT